MGRTGNSPLPSWPGQAPMALTQTLATEGEPDSGAAAGTGCPWQQCLHPPGMEGTARAHGATLLHLLRLLHLTQPEAAGPGVGQGEAAQAAGVLLRPWRCTLVPGSTVLPRGLGRGPSGWLERDIEREE